MDAYVDVHATCKAINFLLNRTKDRVEGLVTFATVKVLCDAIESQIKSEEMWDPYLQEKMHEILKACATLAGICAEENHPASALAQTALDSLESQYLVNLGRGSES